MTFTPASPIASGKPYDVVDVEERTPERLDDFVGERAFHIATGDNPARVQGVGRADGDRVRFVEKDAVAKKDVRVWLIRKQDAAGFTAESSSAF